MRKVDSRTLLAVSVLFFSLNACSQSPSNTEMPEEHDVDSLTLKLNPDVQGVVLNGLLEDSHEWSFDLATPLLTMPQPIVNERYSLRINDSADHIPVAVSDIIKGPAHFSAVVPSGQMPINQITFYEYGTSLYSVQNERLLPPEGEWLPLVKLELHKNQLCLVWPDDVFDQAALLSVNKQRRLQLQKQSFTTPLCVESEDAEQTEWRVNLRRPMFAVQLITNQQ